MPPDSDHHRTRSHRTVDFIRWEVFLLLCGRNRYRGGTLTLKRVNMDGADRQTILKLDSALPGTKFRPSRIYPLSTISSDGKRIAVSAFLGDGKIPDAPWGLMVFDIDATTVNLILHGQSWCNVHPQYSRSTDSDASHDILVQENHGNQCDPRGTLIKLVGGAGADIHVIRSEERR